MPFGDYFILVQYIILIVLVTCPGWILCKGKKKPTGETSSKKGKSSAETLQVKSAIKPPITDPSPSMLGQVKEEAKKEESKKTTDEKPSGEKKDKEAEAGGAKTPKDASADPKSKETSLKSFPKFEMPTESKKKKKLAENEVDKKEKMKNGFYQPKSDEDDTLEKIDSLHVEQSDKTKRSQKKKK